MNYRRDRKPLLILGARILSLAISTAAFSQTIYNPADPANAAWIRTFDRDLAQTQNGGELECRVETKQPMLDFSLRYRTGYYATVPVTQFQPKETSFMIGLRVTSRETGAVYHLAQVAHLPAAPRGRDIVINFSGGFEPGEGRYRVDWSIRDERGRRCSKSWDVELALDGKDRTVVRAVPAGTIRRLADVEKPGVEKPYRIAVILNAAPIVAGSPKLSAKDRSVLLDTVKSIFTRTPFQQVSLSVMNLEKQKEILSAGPAVKVNNTNLAEALGRLEFTTVGLNQLRRPEGQVDFLADAVTGSVRAAAPDAVIFVGPNGGEAIRTPRKLSSALSDNAPLFFYLQLNDYVGGSPYQDTIEKLTKAEGGRVFTIYKPRQLASALRKIEDDLHAAKQTRARLSVGTSRVGI